MRITEVISIMILGIIMSSCDLEPEKVEVTKEDIQYEIEWRSERFRELEYEGLVTIYARRLIDSAYSDVMERESRNYYYIRIDISNQGIIDSNDNLQHYQAKIDSLKQELQNYENK